MSTPAARLADIAGQLSDLAAELDHRQGKDDPLAPHPDTLDLLAHRATHRAQIHPNVPVALGLSGRLAAFGRDQGLNLGDAAAVALDAFLRAAGYPPARNPHP